MRSNTCNYRRECCGNECSTSTSSSSSSRRDKGVGSSKRGSGSPHIYNTTQHRATSQYTRPHNITPRHNYISPQTTTPYYTTQHRTPLHSTILPHTPYHCLWLTVSRGGEAQVFRVLLNEALDEVNLFYG
ncbi:hypothetical protein E2C01_025986 [Portunus trituberculatus]|uniref:Uncharacterized protein n=1 Tax=Portunus trituberculatus TaxID=210409 RepID=A0A5B7EEM0_PORTR|nr:hypothetical protein [Portunus trituberculatus]